MKLYSALNSADLLLQTSKSGTTRIGFILDRDDDHTQGLSIDDPHVIYTRMADVEGEIFANTDLEKAIGAAFGVTRTQARMMTDGAILSLESCASNLREWIELRLIAATCGKPHLAPLARLSPINDDHFGSLLQPEASDRELAIRQAVNEMGREAEAVAVKSIVRGHFDAAQGHLLLKGKWIGPYLLWRARSAFADQVIKQATTAGTILAACLATLSWNSLWLLHYKKAFDRFLSSTGRPTQGSTPLIQSLPGSSPARVSQANSSSTETCAGNG